MPKPERDVKAWLQARVDEYGGVEAARPEGFTQRAWREVCRHHDVSHGKKKISTLDEALKAVADLAQS